MTPILIKTIRSNLELTQRQFGAMLGKSPSAVKRWEAGRHPMDQTTIKLLMVLLQKKGVACVPKMPRLRRS